MGTGAIREFRFVDGNANIIRMVYNDELYRTATIDLLSTLARIGDDGCTATKELAKTQMALVEDFVKREFNSARS